MVDFELFTLKNGLKVIFHRDVSTPIAAVNTLYNVGARDEGEHQTGFAHLFEHLMFGGSVNIPNFDEPLQMVGGDNNAFTSNDITNYYITLPYTNIETAFWLESDRMLNLAFTEKSLEVQRNVVIEEFKQNYLNQPYGDVWLLLRPLAYEKHPYKWATIGKEISHIEDATMEDVKAFFAKYYKPNNAILSIAGNFELEDIKQKVEKWFGDIPQGDKWDRKLPKEPEQTSTKRLTVKRDVPANAIYKAYKMCGRKSSDYYATDILTDILCQGKSSRLYVELVKEKNLFSEINAYVLGSFDDGLMVIDGKLQSDISFEKAEEAINEQVQLLKTNVLPELELQKIKNKLESIRLFSETNVLNKAMNLAYHELLGDANDINLETNYYNNVTAKQVQRIANKILNEENCSTLIYSKNKWNDIRPNPSP